ncbi:MAG TPA: hypothetical protein VGV93_10800 [Acidimicrobiales bacterium]|nr:hypothetical protein [Acidimicrobiales bacterium]
MTEHVIRSESPSGLAGVPLPPHRARLWDVPTVAALGAHTYWRRPELSGIKCRPRAPRRWHRILGAILGALWGASETWAGLAVLSPRRDLAVSFWLPGRWWRLAARMLVFFVLFLLGLVLFSAVLWLVFRVDVVPALVVVGVLIVLGIGALARVDRRAHRGRGPKRVPGMVSITGLASHGGTAGSPSDFLREEMLPWVNEHNVSVYAAAASPVHARLYAGWGFVPAPQYGPLALIRPPAAGSVGS